MYLRKSYDNKVQLFSDLVEKLNEALSTENASVDRIISRIDQTPNPNRRSKTKTQLGGKPTDAKADLSLSFVSTTMPRGNNLNLPKNRKSKTEDNGLENSMPEEYELVQMRRDSALKHDELVAYDSLIRTMHMMDTSQRHGKSLDRKVQREFHELSISDGRWKYINYGTDKHYKAYVLNS